MVTSVCIPTRSVGTRKDVYIDYPFEEVMFRRTCAEGLIHRKFYGEKETSEPIPGNN